MGGDLAAAADDFVHVLVEHGADANEILKFAVDADLKIALQEFADEEAFAEEEEDEDEDDYYGSYDENDD
jgi:hypothetical protein